MGIAISYPGFLGGEWDLGGYMSSDLGGMDIGIGKYTLDFGYSKGSISDMACEVNTNIYAHWGMHGATVSMDQNMDITGMTYHFGPGYNLGVVASPTVIWSLKHGFGTP